jgi:hypothetical protein
VYAATPVASYNFLQTQVHPFFQVGELVKSVTVTAFCPQLPAAHVWQESGGSGSTLAIAIGRAVDELLSLPHVKGKRIESLKLTVQVVE